MLHVLCTPGTFNGILALQSGIVQVGTHASLLCVMTRTSIGVHMEVIFSFMKKLNARRSPPFFKAGFLLSLTISVSAASLVRHLAHVLEEMASHRKRDLRRLRAVKMHYTVDVTQPSAYFRLCLTDMNLCIDFLRKEASYTHRA